MAVVWLLAAFSFGAAAGAQASEISTATVDSSESVPAAPASASSTVSEASRRLPTRRTPVSSDSSSPTIDQSSAIVADSPSPSAANPTSGPTDASDTTTQVAEGLAGLPRDAAISPQMAGNSRQEITESLPGDRVRPLAEEALQGASISSPQKFTGSSRRMGGSYRSRRQALPLKRRVRS